MSHSNAILSQLLKLASTAQSSLTMAKVIMAGLGFWQHNIIYYVTRQRGNPKYDAVESMAVTKGTGVLSDKIIRFNSLRSPKNNCRM